MASERWPDFLIIGAAKSGTTTLYRYLSEHPDIYMSAVKEPRYFAFTEAAPDPADPVLRDSVTTKDAYLKLFENAASKQVLGEASPIYLAEPRACEAIAAAIPEVKLVVILRDPAERAFSHFLMSQRQGYEPESSFIKALRVPEINIGSWRRVRPYLPYSRYADGLARFFSRFGRDRVLVLLHEELSNNAVETMRKVTEFLHVAPLEIKDEKRANVGYAVNSTKITRLLKHPNLQWLKMTLPTWMVGLVKKTIKRANTTERKITHEERLFAIECLRDDIDKLEILLGRDLSAWRE